MSTTELPIVTAYTITYQQREKVLDTVRDLMQQHYPADRLHLIVLDDGSHDGTYESLVDLATDSTVPLHVLRQPHVRDYMNTALWNQCIEAARPETQVFVQVDDVRMKPDFIASHVRWHRQSDAYLVTGAKFEGDEETWSLSSCKRAVLAGPDGSAGPCDYLAVWGASMSFTRAMADRITTPPHDRPYDERIVGWGFQEIEFAYRIEQAGGTLIYDPGAGVFHRNHTASSESARGLDRQQIVRSGFTQNLQYLKEKHGLDDLHWPWR